MAEIYEKGQVVIPKYLRDMFNLRPGSQVSFHVENNRIYIDPAVEVLAEMERLAAGGTNTFEQTQSEILRMKQKRMERIRHVPGL